MTAPRLVTVTLARAWDPGAAGQENGRIEFDVVLDPHGHPDVNAWLADPATWPARRYDGASATQSGHVEHDEDGWQLRFHSGDAPDPDAPSFRLCRIDAGLRPGLVLTLRAQGGEETTWRVVGVSAPEG